MILNLNNLLFFSMFSLGAAMFSQNKYMVYNFPANFKAEIHINGFANHNLNYVNGYVQIFSKNNKMIIYSGFEQVNNLFYENNKINFYKQNFILYADFNFDGKKDFAIKEKVKNCYGTPSYKIYLNQSNETFILNQSLSKLTQKYCGIFYTDTITNNIITYTQSGCCLHTDYFFKLENDEPVLIKKIITDATNLPFILKTSLVNDNDEIKAQKTIRYIDFNLPDLNNIFSFDIADASLNSNEIVGSVFVFTYNDTLYYAFVYKQTIIEVASYFPNEKYQKNFFIYYPNDNKLVFGFDDIRYEIYENNQNISKMDTGINVIVNDMADFSKAIPISVKGTFKKLLQLKPVNLKVIN